MFDGGPAAEPDGSYGNISAAHASTM